MNKSIQSIRSSLVAFNANAKLVSPRNAYALAFIMIATSPAYAQFEKATAGLNKVRDWLLIVGAILVSIACVFVGAKMAFGAAQFKDVAPVFWGGTLMGGGAAIAALFF